MSKGSTGSISSAPRLESWDDLTKLGEYILDQLGHDRRSDDLLVHWVAHQLAEHMQAAETADDPAERGAAREAAALLIAQLWRARGGWPQGWPPDAVQRFTHGVRHAVAQNHEEEIVQLPPWLSTLAEHAVLQWEERVAWTNAALLELGDDQLRQALEAAPDPAPEPADIGGISWQLSRYEKAEEWIADYAQEGEDPSRRKDRAEILGRVLTDISERRASLIERTLKDARRGQRRKPSLQAARIASTGIRGSLRRSRKLRAH
jgi:hypothetical protein